MLPSLLMPTALLIPSCHPLLWLIEKTGSLRVEERNPSISEEDAALSRDATEKRRRNRPLYLCCSYLVSSHHHVNRLLLPSLALETSCTANACTMGLQCEPAAPVRRRHDVRDRAMPRPTANRSDDTFEKRLNGAVAVVPFDEALRGISLALQE